MTSRLLIPSLCSRVLLPTTRLATIKTPLRSIYRANVIKQCSCTQANSSRTRLFSTESADKEKSATEILINAAKNETLTPGVITKQITEARSIKSSRYLSAIIKSMLVTNSSAADSSCNFTFQTHLLNQTTCWELMDSIVKTAGRDSRSRIDSRYAVEIYRVAIERRWKIESEVLESVAEFLAESCYLSYAGSIEEIHKNMVDGATDGVFSKVDRLDPNRATIKDVIEAQSLVNSKNNNDNQMEVRGTLDVEASSAALDSVFGILKALVADHDHKLSSEALDHMVRAFCVFGRLENAEYAFDQTLIGGTYNRHIASIYESMILMYYQAAVPQKADSMFMKYREGWTKYWESIRTTLVMPDHVSANAEKWRMKSEELVQMPGIVEVNQLAKLCSRSAAPYYRRALHFISERKYKEAFEFVVDSKYTDHIAFTETHYDVIIRGLARSPFPNLARDLYWEMQRGGVNVSEDGICADKLVFSKVPLLSTANAIVSLLCDSGDFDQILRIVRSFTENVETREYVKPAIIIILRALDNGDLHIALMAVQYLVMCEERSGALSSNRKTQSEWLEEAFEKAIKMGESVEDSTKSPFVKLFAESIVRSTVARGVDPEEWNSCVVAAAFGAVYQIDSGKSSLLYDRLFCAIRERSLLKYPKVAGVVAEIFDLILHSMPESIEANFEGNATILDQWVAQNEGILRSEAYWNCTLQALAVSISTAGADNIKALVRKITTSMRILSSANVRVYPGVFTAVNEVLADCGLPVVNIDDNGNKFELDTSSPHLSKNIEQKQKQKQKETVNSWVVSKTPDKIAWEIGKRTPLQDKLKWYNKCRNDGIVPDHNALTHLLRTLLAVNGKERIFDKIVEQHVPEYLKALKGHRQLEEGYASTVLSVAMRKHAEKNEVEEAARYHNTIVDFGSYPDSHANAALLNALMNADTPLPVLKRGWSDSTIPQTFGIPPVSFPSSMMPFDKFLVPKDKKERHVMVAQIALSMFWSMMSTKTVWPTNRFYILLLQSLGGAQKHVELRVIFDVGIPTIARQMPPELRINPNHAMSPVIWGVAMEQAMRMKDLNLARYWFKEYRMSALPIFREQASAYSRFFYRNSPPAHRLFELARPYYNITRIMKDKVEDGIWYDLEEVVATLELDRLRAMDKLPLPFNGAFWILKIYTEVDEYLDMENAEAIAEEIIALWQDKSLPKLARPQSSMHVAACWAMMIRGYIGILLKEQASIDPDLIKIGIARERACVWLRKWAKMFGGANGDPASKLFGKAMLTKEEITTMSNIADGVDKLAAKETKKLMNRVL